MKKIITLSAIAFLATTSYANTDMQAQIDELTAKIEKLEKKQVKNTKKISKVNSLAAKDNIKFDVDFRTSYDSISYKTAGSVWDGGMGLDSAPSEYKNSSLYSMRLWLGMGYAPQGTDMVFKGQLSVNKAMGASYGQRATGMGFDTFDWVVNETLGDGTVKLREAFWLWTPTVGGVGTTLSVGRRPATNGYLINLRDDDKAKSPLGHVINMEFDGASAGVSLDSLVPGGNFKICIGRGLTNAASWASSASYYATGYPTLAAQPNYTTVDGSLDNTDMVGFILKAYDDGQYALVGTYYRGFNVPGMDASGFNPGAAVDPSTGNVMIMDTLGDMDGAALSFKVEGIGDEINDFLDETIFFASAAWSKSNPDADKRMLGGNFGESKSGNSYWIGIQTPNLTGGKLGLEYNHGSEDWKAFTYGEDTMIGSKMAVRGSAYEAYWTQPINKAFSMQVRYTYLDYDYTGSDGFFGDGGASAEIGTFTADSQNAVESASDLRVYFRYRY